MSTYLASDAARMAGVTYRQLDYWTTKGHVRATRNIGANPGSGNRRTYTEHEARVLCVMSALVRDGVDPGPAARVARRIVTKGSARLGGLQVSA